MHNHLRWVDFVEIFSSIEKDFVEFFEVWMEIATAEVVWTADFKCNYKTRMESVNYINNIWTKLKDYSQVN